MDDAAPTTSAIDPKQLEERARRLRSLVRKQARRAFVVELAGTPKAGKSTSVSLIKQFFEQCGFNVHLLKERAADCPLPMKGHFFFNTWTMCSMLAEVLATIDTETDLLILDRGVFDALMWLELQSRRGQVTPEEKDVFSKFVTLDRWRLVVDLTFVVKVDPATAMVRENQTRILPKLGSLMNPAALQEINEVLSDVVKENQKRFSLVEFETSNDGVLADNCRLIDGLLGRFEEWADPPILALPREELERIEFGAVAVDSAALLGNGAALAALETLAPALVVKRRSELEATEDFVQLVACGFPQDSGKFFLIKRTEKDAKAGKHGRFTLWKGCHLTCRGDTPGEVKGLVDLAADALRERVREDFHLAIALNPAFRGIVWKKNENHAGLLFEIPIESAEAVRHMGQKEFKKQARFEPNRGQLFKAKDELLTNEEIEPWSRAYLELPE